MTDRELFLPVAAQSSVDALVEMAEHAESLQYQTVWLPETWGRDAVSVLTSVAHATDEVGVGTSILPIYSRSPALLGQTAATLQEVSEGRFRLGLGPSGPIVIENWHGVEYGNPLRRTRETIEVVQQVLSGKEVKYNGEYFDLAGFRLRSDPPDPVPPVETAGMGPKAVELAGRFSDGWHGLMLTRDGLRDRLTDLERGAEMGDRDIDNIRVTMSLTCAALEDGDRARELATAHSIFYIGSMGTFYRDSLARQGYEDAAHDIYELVQSGDREAAAQRFNEEDLLRELTVAGTPEEALDQLHQWETTEGVDAVSVSFPRGATVEEIRSTTEALSP